MRLNKIVLLLAASGLSRKEMVSSLREIFDADEDDLMGAIREVRSLLDNRELSREENDYYLPSSRVSSHQTALFKGAASDRLIYQISKILREDSGLTTAKASELLLDALREDLGKNSTRDLPSLNKESFLLWLRKLAAQVPQSALLSAAAKIRNRYVHTNRSDWPLEHK